MTTHKTSRSYQTFETSTGTIKYPFTNDFMFHVVLEKSGECVRRKLLSINFSLSVLNLRRIDLGGFAYDSSTG